MYPKFAQFKDYNQFIITGPQRSGTTIMARMLSNEFHILDRYEMQFLHQCEEALNLYYRIAIQGPRFSHLLERITNKWPHILVIFMQRPVDEIIASQKRINWAGEARERSNYKKHFPEFYSDDIPIAQIKYNVFYNYQLPRYKNVVPFDYYDLKDHPMWIEKEYRINFKPHQIAIKEEHCLTIDGHIDYTEEKK